MSEARHTLACADIGVEPRHALHFYTIDKSILPATMRVSLQTGQSVLNSTANYARLFLDTILPLELKRVISVDVDMVFQTDIAKLWDHPILHSSGHFMAASPMWTKSTLDATLHFQAAPGAVDELKRLYKLRYNRELDFSPVAFNSGLFMLDLDAWRRLQKSDEVRFWMQAHAASPIPLWRLGLSIIAFSERVSNGCRHAADLARHFERPVDARRSPMECGRARVDDRI